MILSTSIFATAASSGLVSLDTVDYLVIAVYFAFVLGNLHPGIWWGALMLVLVLGLVYTFKFWPSRTME